MVDGVEFTRVLVGFGRELRRAGLPVGTGDVLTYGAAGALLNPADLVDLYWAGRSTLVTRRDHLPVYDAVFRRYFLDEPEEDGAPPPYSVRQRTDAAATLQLPDPEHGPAGTPEDEREARMGLVASGATTMRHRSFAACTPEELAALRRIVRAAVRRFGEPGELAWRTRRLRTRPLTLVLDVSGSMADYSRALLQFAHGTSRSARKVEVFCFGTRLTRITRQLDHRRPDDALRAAAARVVDWEGGTRIGESLATFVREWGRRGMSRGGIVVICSDGLDRGDPETLDTALRKLTRLSHKIVWLNPHKGGHGEDWVPSSLGMVVAAPYIDELLSGHDLASLDVLAAVLPRLR